MFQRFVDVSAMIKSGMGVWPGDPEVTLASASDYEKDGYLVTSITMGTHAGTHVDFPGHLPGISKGKPEMSLLIGQCQVVGQERLAQLIDNPDNVPERMLIKGILPSKAGFEVLTKSGLMLVGTERMSVDAGEGLTIHRFLLEAGVAIIEGLDLGEAEEGPSFLIALPLSLDCTDAAPARVVLAY